MVGRARLQQQQKDYTAPADVHHRASSPSRKRNTSSPCWIYCFHATVFGAEALLPGGGSSEAWSTASAASATPGMPLADLETAYAKPFLSVSEGGCPEV